MLPDHGESGIMRKVLIALICQSLHCWRNMFKGCQGIDEYKGNWFWKKYTFIGCSCGKTFHGEASQTLKDLGLIQNKLKIVEAKSFSELKYPIYTLDVYLLDNQGIGEEDTEEIFIRALYSPTKMEQIIISRPIEAGDEDGMDVVLQELNGDISEHTDIEVITDRPKDENGICKFITKKEFEKNRIMIRVYQTMFDTLK